MKKINNLFFNILISLLCSLPIGCKTFVGTEWKRIREYTKIEYNYNFKRINEIAYHFKIQQENNFLKINLKESKHQKIYSGKRKVTYQILEKYKKFKDKTDYWIKALIWGTFLSGLAAIGESSTYQNGERRDIEKASAAGIGFGLGAIIGLANADTKTIEEKTGERKTEIINKEEWTLDKLINKELIHKNKQSQNTEVTFKSKYFKFLEADGPKNFITKRTNKEGNIKICLIEYPKNFAFIKKDVIQKIKNDSTIEKIKLNIRKQITSSLSTKINEKYYPIEIEVKGKNLEDILFNQNISCYVKGYEWKKEDLYSTLKNFIDKEINSKIKNITIKAISKKNSKPIENVIIQMKYFGPLPKELAQRYFKEDLITWSLRYITKYDIKTKKTDYRGIAKFKVYTPCKLEIDATHEDFLSPLNTIKIEKDLEYTIKLFEFKK